MVTILPGKKEPRQLATWLRPLIQDLRILHRGVRAVDGETKEIFTLQAHMVLFVADKKMARTALCLKGHNARFPCRICDIEGNVQIPLSHFSLFAFVGGDSNLRSGYRNAIVLSVEQAVLVTST